MTTVPRWLYPNRVWDSAAVLTSSSINSGQPLAWLKDQLRSKTARTSIGWDVDANNGKLDFNNGSNLTATIASGNYAAGADLATAVQTALTAAYGTGVWTVTYSPSTHKFTITHSLTAFVLKWSTGTNAAISIGKDLGFDTSSDSGSSTTQTGANAVYQSRKWFKADFGSPLSAQAGVVINHNAGAGGTFTLQGNATDAWSAPSFPQVLAGDATIRIAFFATQTFRWWRLLIDDTGNTAGYSEVGIWFVGPYIQPSVTYSIDFHEEPQDLSETAMSVGGATFLTQRSQQQTWSLNWAEIPDADKVLLRAAADAHPVGKPFFMALDAVANPTTQTFYVYLPAKPRFDYVPGNPYWNVSHSLNEALGG